MDAYLETHNRQRSRRGRDMKGRTPYEVFKAGMPKESPVPEEASRTEVKTAA